jgi:hypothetical protein
MNGKKAKAARREKVVWQGSFDETRIDDSSHNAPARTPNTKREFEEYCRCAVNPIYFINNYVQIQDPVRGRIPFLLYPFQRVALKMFLRKRFNIVLKPRQMGLSWLVAMFALWLAMFRPHQTVIVISIKEDTAKRFLDKIKYAYRYLPCWLKADIEHENFSTIVFSNHSRIMSVPTSEDAGRSEGISLLIVDEAAFVRWIDKIWAAAFPTLSTGGMGILLSTANGMGNFFANKWRDACEQLSDFNPIQLHWRMHPDRDDAWYRVQRRELGPALTAQEVDCDFLNSGRPAFDTATLSEWSEVLRHRAPAQVLYNNDMFDGPYDKKAEGLYIFKKPVEGRDYIIGADCATGDGSDYNACHVLDWATGEQMAEFRVLCKPDQWANYLFALGKMYNWAHLAAERNGIGLAVTQKLIDKRYPNLYVYIKEDAKSDPEVSTKHLVSEKTEIVGFNTTSANRPVIIDTTEELIREHQSLREQGVVDFYLINGMRTINECLVFNWQDAGKPNPRANEGYNDDLVISLCIAHQVRLRYRPRRNLPTLFK